MQMKIRNGHTFDDVLLIPKHSNIESRSKISLDVDLGKGIKLKMPIISANMKHITGVDMAIAIAKFGGLPILHRFESLENQIKTFMEASKYGAIGCSIGVKEDDYDNVTAFIRAGCPVLCIDVAHGDSDPAVNMVKYIATNFPNILLIAGNVATATGADMLYKAGADIIKTGLGSGSLCSTRIETGNGVPQMTALSDVFKESKKSFAKEKGYVEVRNTPPYDDQVVYVESGYVNEYKNRKFKIIADGGIRNAGDCVKSLCFSDTVMLGSILAGTDEAPGEIETDIYTNQKYKIYAGSSTHKSNRVEGVIRRVPYKGPVDKILTKIKEGIESGLSYQGCNNLEELKKDPQFVQISPAGLVESHPHTYT